MLLGRTGEPSERRRGTGGSVVQHRCEESRGAALCKLHVTNAPRHVQPDGVHVPDKSKTPFSEYTIILIIVIEVTREAAVNVLQFFGCCLHVPDVDPRHRCGVSKVCTIYNFITMLLVVLLDRNLRHVVGAVGFLGGDF